MSVWIVYSSDPETNITAVSAVFKTEEEAWRYAQLADGRVFEPWKLCDTVDDLAYAAVRMTEDGRLARIEMRYTQERLHRYGFQNYVSMSDKSTPEMWFHTRGHDEGDAYMTTSRFVRKVRNANAWGDERATRRIQTGTDCSHMGRG